MGSWGIVGNWEVVRRRRDGLVVLELLVEWLLLVGEEMLLDFLECDC